MEFQVKNKDLIIISSDGMFDVVSDEMLLKIVNNQNEKVELLK
jgi:serine/threonine protein phosphatase PrpC